MGDEAIRLLRKFAISPEAAYADASVVTTSANARHQSRNKLLLKLMNKPTDQELAQQQRYRRDYLFSDEAYGQRCRDNERDMNAMWRGGIKWGGLAGLAIFAFFAALGAPTGGAVLGIGLIGFVLFPVLLA